MEISNSCCTLGQSSLLMGAKSWYFLHTFHPSGCLPAFTHSSPGNSTHGDGGEEWRRKEIGEEIEEEKK